MEKIFVLLLIIVFLSGKNKKSLLGMAFSKQVHLTFSKWENKHAARRLLCVSLILL